MNRESIKNVPGGRQHHDRENITCERDCTFFPGLTSLIATSAAVLAAARTSAALPVTGPFVITWVWATTAIKPSIWQPISLSNENRIVSITIQFPKKKITEQVGARQFNYILTISFSSRTASSVASGEKWQTVLFTDTQVGKAMPLSIFLFAFL